LGIRRFRGNFGHWHDLTGTEPARRGDGVELGGVHVQEDRNGVRRTLLNGYPGATGLASSASEAAGHGAAVTSWPAAS